MRTFGRVTNPDGSKTWQVVQTDANGMNDAVYFTTLAQVLLLNLYESPFFGNYGIPQYQTVVTQVFPDYYVQQTQQFMSSFFASLLITRVTAPAPVYKVSVTFHNGAIVNAAVPY